RALVVAVLARVRRTSFFFQAEDGIRDFHVTGVQTCALPISERKRALIAGYRVEGGFDQIDARAGRGGPQQVYDRAGCGVVARRRSEERRVGKGVDRGGSRTDGTTRERSD